MMGYFGPVILSGFFQLPTRHIPIGPAQSFTARQSRRTGEPPYKFGELAHKNIWYMLLPPGGLVQSKLQRSIYSHLNRHVFTVESLLRRCAANKKFPFRTGPAELVQWMPCFYCFPCNQLDI